MPREIVTHRGNKPPDWEGEGTIAWFPSEKESVKKDGPNIAIVGGGPGGLFTAYILNQRMPNANITIFEASEVCGGKIYTDKFEDGTPFEAGVAELYEYLGSGNKDPLRLLIEEDLKLKTIDISGGTVILHNTILHDLDEIEKEYGYDTRKRLEAFHQKMTELMPLEKYAHRWQPDNEHPWANKTFRECIEEELTGIGGIDEVAREYIETAVHSDLATESHTCNGLNGIKNVLMDNDKYMQVFHVVGGIERIVEGLLEHIDANIKVSTCVTGVAKVVDSDKYRVSLLVVGEEELTERTEDFDSVLVALPNHFLRTIQWEGQLAQAIHDIIAHYDLPAHYLRVSILFDKKWWADFKIPGEFWMMDMFNGCCCYDESTRWSRKSPHHSENQKRGDDGKFLAVKDDEEKGGHVFSFLIAGGDALLMCSANQDDECIVEHVLECLPPIMRELAQDHFLEAQVDRYVGSINAQPGGWPAEELRGEHSPEPLEHPGVFLVGDYFFDSTLNAALMSSNVAVELLLEFFGVKSGKVTKAIEQLEVKDTGI